MKSMDTDAATMKQEGTRARLKHLLWMLAIPFLNIFYMALNHAGPHVHSLATEWDRQLPLIPIFIIPYILWYPFVTLALVFMCFKNVKIYFRTLIALCLGLIICYLIYFCFQTTISRPAIENTGLLSHLLKIVYAQDQPYNCFPSIHVLTSYLMLKGSKVFHLRTRLLVIAIGIMIMASTLFVKQHVLADVIAAIALAEFTYWVSGLLLTLSSNQNIQNERSADPYIHKMDKTM